MEERQWEQLFCEYFLSSKEHESDASHDLSHFKRVSETSKEIAAFEKEETDALILLAAAYFHDVVNLPKNHPQSMMSSRFSAAKAKEILLSMGFPESKLKTVCSAIETHSYSAGLIPETLEAKIIQDADRVESLGALGILRTFYVSGRMQRAPFDEKDLFAKHRPLDDKKYGLDHFYCKLFKLPSLLQTEGGRQIALKRAEFLQFFVDQLQSNVEDKSGGALSIVWACYEAGKNNLKLFDANDPFCEARIAEENQYVVDKLMQYRKDDTFIDAFLSQLNDELCQKSLSGVACL